jgi:hypothetical protein
MCQMQVNYLCAFKNCLYQKILERNQCLNAYCAVSFLSVVNKLTVLTFCGTE